MHPAIGSGIATGDASVSYWPIVFLTQVTVPEVFAKVNLRFLFVSKLEISKLSPTAMNCHEKKTLRHSLKCAPNLISVTPEKRPK